MYTYAPVTVLLIFSESVWPTISRTTEQISHNTCCNSSLYYYVCQIWLSSIELMFKMTTDILLPKIIDHTKKSTSWGLRRGVTTPLLHTRYSSSPLGVGLHCCPAIALIFCIWMVWSCLYSGEIENLSTSIINRVRLQENASLWDI